MKGEKDAPTAPVGHIYQLVYANPVENLDEERQNQKC